jgi:competence protein ComEA
LAAIDVNHATAQELQQIKGIGAKTAQRIIVERTRGPFESLEHLSERLSGIGPKTVLKLRAGGLCAGTSQASCAAAQTLTINKRTGSKRNESKRTSSRNRVPSALVVTPEILQLP